MRPLQMYVCEFGSAMFLKFSLDEQLGSFALIKFD
jgi:hypothetical protein